MRKKKEHKAANHERWLLTYSDLITLLMIFFVVMFASSSVDKQKFKALSESMSVAMGSGKHIIGDETSVAINENPSINEANIEGDKLTQLKDQLDKYLQQNNMSDTTSTTISERGLVVSLNNSLFFDPGKADLKPEYESRLVEIGNILRQMNNYIRVEGHTDNMPISNALYHSNWQLSSVRAANVVEVLIAKSSIDPTKLTTVGYGEYRPIADNSTPEGRQKNRRVDLVLMSSSFNATEEK